MVRSPHGHAEIQRVDTRAAAQMPGVLAVLTGADYMADGLGSIPCDMPRKRRDGSPMYKPFRPAVTPTGCAMSARCVAVVVAETAAQARDAAERVEVEYAPLPPVVERADAAKPGAPLLWSDCAGNEFDLLHGGRRQGDRCRHRQGRASRAPEDRDPAHHRGGDGAARRARHLGPGEARYTLHVGLQRPFLFRRNIAQNVLKIPETDLRLVTGDIGGSFGLRGSIFPEMIAVLWASRARRSPGEVARRPHRKLRRRRPRARQRHRRDAGARRRGQVPRAQGQDRRQPGRVPLVPRRGPAHRQHRRADRRLQVRGGACRGLGLDDQHLADLALSRRGTAGGVVRDRAHDRHRGRRDGARPGRAAAQEHDPGRARCRTRRRSPSATTRARSRRRWTWRCTSPIAQASPSAATGSKKRGKLRGIGVTTTIEAAAGGEGLETAELRFDPTGSVQLVCGAVSHGQGHETTFIQMLCDRLPVDPDKVRYIQGDTDKVAFGVGTVGSRSATMAGSAVRQATDKIVAKGKKIAAHMLEAAEADIVFESGAFQIAGTDRKVAFDEVVKAAFEPDEAAQGAWSRGCTRPRPSPTTRPTSRTAATSARSRSIPTPARSQIVELCRWSTTSAR